MATVLSAVAGIAAADSASAVTGNVPVADGVYLESPWVLSGGTAFVDVVGTTTCGVVDSAAFVDSHGTTQLALQGGGDNFWPVRDIAFVDPVTNSPLPIGRTEPDFGHLLVTCVPNGGGAANTVSLPLTVSPRQPASIYHSPTAWTWYTPGAVIAGAQVTISALGFLPGESTTVSIVNETQYFSNSNGFTGTVTTPVTVIADGEGAVTAQLTLPTGWASADSLDLIAAGASSHYLLVSGPGTPPNGDPSLNLATTDSAFPGSAVSIAAGGYEPGETVTIGLHSSSAPAIQLGTMIASPAGTVFGTVYLPTAVLPGPYRVWVGAKVISYLLLNAPLAVGPAPITTRISGDDRYQTGVAISQSFAPFAPGTGTVYLASGQAFPDALGAGALAAEIGAPVLLTSSDSLPESVRAELLRLHPARIKVVGGTSAVSAAALADALGLPFTHSMTRLGGADRYATNRLLIADALPHATTVYVATGTNFPDALAAGPPAAKASGAVVLINGSASSLDQATLTFLSDLGVSQVRLVGGTSVISTAIQNQLSGIYTNGVTRLAGTDRYDTAAQIVGQAWPDTAPHVILTSGVNFPDALAAGALGLPMLTTAPNCIPAAILTRLGALKISALTLVGGTSALSQGVANFDHC